jgi:phosphatidylglycerophosphate synthase
MTTDGERWTADQLGALRSARWRPGAQAAFLRAAQARTNSTRRARPALARQARSWILAGAAAWPLLARLRPGGVFRRVQGRGLTWWGLCALMLDWHLGMVETPTGRPVPLGAADALTLLRAWLVPAVAEAGEPRLVLIGALTDFADGRVARATRTTRLGRDLEGLVDAGFFVAALGGAVAAGQLSPRAAGLERARLVAGTVYATAAYLAAGHAPDPAVTRSGRSAAPLRSAALLAAGLGRRRLADRLLFAATAAAIAGLIGGQVLGGRGAPSSATTAATTR